MHPFPIFLNKCQKESSALRLFHSIVYVNLVLRFAENQPRQRRSHQSIWRSSQHYHVCYSFHFLPPNHMELSVASTFTFPLNALEPSAHLKLPLPKDLGNGLITNKCECNCNCNPGMLISASTFSNSNPVCFHRCTFQRRALLHSSLAPLSFFYLQQSSALCVHSFLCSLWLCTAAVFSASDCNYGLLEECVCVGEFR